MRTYSISQALLAAVALMLGACNKPAAPLAVSEPPPQVVRVSPAQLSDVAEIYQATGTVRAVTRSTLAAQVMATVRRVGVAVGDRVAAGQVLVTLEAPQLASAQAQAQAAVAEAESAVPEAAAAINAARAQVALATATHQRMTTLFGKASVSRQEMDEAEARLKQSQTALEMAEARRQQVEARGNQSRQALDSARTISSYLTLRAPFAGVVTEKIAQPGQVAAPGVPLLTIEQAGTYELEVAIDEARAAAMKTGQELQAAFADLPQPVTVRVTSIVPAIDPASRTLVVRALLPALSAWRSGQFARAEFRLGSRRALTVPASAVVTQGQLQFVYTTDAGRASSRMVTTAAAGAGSVEVLSGLTAGEAVVNPIPAGLQDGRRVVTQ